MKITPAIYFYIPIWTVFGFTFYSVNEWYHTSSKSLCLLCKVYPQFTKPGPILFNTRSVLNRSFQQLHLISLIWGSYSYYKENTYNCWPTSEVGLNTFIFLREILELKINISSHYQTKETPSKGRSTVELIDKIIALTIHCEERYISVLPFQISRKIYVSKNKFYLLVCKDKMEKSV